MIAKGNFYLFYSKKSSNFDHLPLRGPPRTCVRTVVQTTIFQAQKYCLCEHRRYFLGLKDCKFGKFVVILQRILTFESNNLLLYF